MVSSLGPRLGLFVALLHVAAFGLNACRTNDPPPDGSHTLDGSVDGDLVPDSGSIDATPAPDRVSVRDDGLGSDANAVDVPATDAVLDDHVANDASMDATAADARLDVSPRDDGTTGTDVVIPDADSRPPPTDAYDAPVVDGGEQPPPNVIPPLDAATIANVRAIMSRGAAMGNRVTVFSKIGDSITESASFMFDIGHGWFDLGSHGGLAASITYFSATTFADGNDSFDRSSACATAGWTTADALNGGASSPFQTELHATHPAYALMMYGTNDLDHWGTDVFGANLEMLIMQAEALGVVPVLSTIPDRADDPSREPLVLQFNTTIRSIAQRDHLPLMDYWAALQALPNHGVGTDGIHPTTYRGTDGFIEAANFTDAGLQFGYNVRNLTALQMLDVLRRTFTP